MKKLIFLLALLPFMGFFSLFGQNNYRIELSQQLHVHEGWGVSLCWWANMCGRYDEAHVDSLVEWLVSPEGLNYNIFRYNIGGGDDPQWRNCQEHHMGKGKGLRAEMQGFQDELGGAYHWDRDSAQIRIMRLIKQKRPDAIFEAFSNSAPWFMTESGCVAGNSDASKDNLRPDCYEAFAHYLVDVCRHIKEAYGIEFTTLDPFNEPETNYWPASGSQEGCHFDLQSQIAFIKVLHPILKASGLNTEISAADETSVSQSITDIKAYHEAGVLPLLGQFNTHTYSGTALEKAELGTLAKSFGIKLWQSETGSGGKGLQGNLNMANRLIEDIRNLQPAAWVDWQYVEEKSDQWSLVTTNSDWSKYLRHKNYYVRMHFSRFIKAGYRFVSTSNPHALAAVSPQGDELVYVCVNASDASLPFSTELPAHTQIKAQYITSANKTLSPDLKIAISGNQLETILPKQSIATFVFSL